MQCWLQSKCKKFNNYQVCDPYCIKRIKLDTLYNNSLLTYTQRNHVNLVAEAVDKQAFKQLSEIQKSIVKFIQEGNNLYLYSSNPGTGKTSWAVRLIQSYFNNIWPTCDLTCKALFINVPFFLLELKRNISQPSEYIEHVKANIYTVDLVIWDEIATKSASEFEHENLLNIIELRLNNRKSNIYTSNLNPADIRDKLGERLYSRIINNATLIELKGADKRGIL